MLNTLLRRCLRIVKDYFTNAGIGYQGFMHFLHVHKLELREGASRYPGILLFVLMRYFILVMSPCVIKHLC